jgi:hypothetical protein
MGFAFMGSLYHLEVEDKDFYIDLLFYYHRLRCLVAIDLKMNEFMPEYAGKMNFYLSALAWYGTLKISLLLGYYCARAKVGLLPNIP